MLRMAHRLLQSPLVHEDTKDAVRNATVIVADDVCKYLKSATSATDHSATFLSLCPNIRLPLAPLLIEWAMPDISPVQQVAVLCVGNDRTFSVGFLKRNPEVLEPMRETHAAGGDSYYFSAFRFHGNGITQDVEGIASHDRLGSLSHIAPATGRHIKCDAQLAVFLCQPAFMAISFMHCKNVAVQESPEDAPPPKWIRRQRVPEVRYRVLDIEPMKQVLRTEGRIEETGLKKALHICRGHFATYTEEKPLFGKVSGTFWVPQCIKGNHKHGTVVKDYSITT